jgi:hypothetical protein
MLSDQPQWDHGLPDVVGIGAKEVRNFVEFNSD